MAEMLAESSDLESTTIGIYRTAAVVKGGRRFSFSALVVVGDRNGRVGLGYGKAPGVPAAIEKAQKDAKKNLVSVKLQGGTIPHPVDARFGAAKVRLVPAAPGTGVIAGGTARAVLDMVGVKDCLTKSFGSNNQKNVSKAVLQGLTQLKLKEEISTGRGVDLEKTVVEEILEAGKRFAPQVADGAEKAKGPVNLVGQKSGGRRGGGGGRGRRGGGGGGRGRRDDAPATEAAAPAGGDAPAPAADAPPAGDAPAAESKPEA